MTPEELLRAAAQDVAERAPDDELSPSGVRTRALKVRQRRRVGVGVGAAAAALLVVAGLQVLGDPRVAPDPVEPPSPSPSPSTVGPREPVVTFPQITADDLREYDELATVTNAQLDNLGVTELTFEVPVRDRFAFEYDLFCDGDPDTWYVLVVGTGGASASGNCSQPEPQPFPTFPTTLSPFGHSGDATETLEVRMFVTGPLPKSHADCFEQQSPADCQDLTPPLEPLAATDVTFGVSVYEYWAPAVAEFAGEAIAARASAEGEDYVLSQVLTSTPGQQRFTTTLPATGRDRLVTVLDAVTDRGIACATQASSREEEEACLAVPTLRIGNRTVVLERGEFGEIPLLGGRHGFFRVPAGDEVEVGVRVAGNPDHVDYALLVFEES